MNASNELEVDWGDEQVQLLFPDNKPTWNTKVVYGVVAALNSRQYTAVTLRLSPPDGDLDTVLLGLSDKLSMLLPPVGLISLQLQSPHHFAHTAVLKEISGQFQLRITPTLDRGEVALSYKALLVRRGPNVALPDYNVKLGQAQQLEWMPEWFEAESYSSGRSIVQWELPADIPQNFKFPQESDMVEHKVGPNLDNFEDNGMPLLHSGRGAQFHVGVGNKSLRPETTLTTHWNTSTLHVPLSNLDGPPHQQFNRRLNTFFKQVIPMLPVGSISAQLLRVRADTPIDREEDTREILEAKWNSNDNRGVLWARHDDFASGQNFVLSSYDDMPEDAVAVAHVVLRITYNPPENYPPFYLHSSTCQGIGAFSKDKRLLHLSHIELWLRTRSSLSQLAASKLFNPVYPCCLLTPTSQMPSLHGFLSSVTFDAHFDCSSSCRSLYPAEWVFVVYIPGSDESHSQALVQKLDKTVKKIPFIYPQARRLDVVLVLEPGFVKACIYPFAQKHDWRVIDVCVNDDVSLGQNQRDKKDAFSLLAENSMYSLSGDATAAQQSAIKAWLENGGRTPPTDCYARHFIANLAVDKILDDHLSSLTKGGTPGIRWLFLRQTIAKCGASGVLWRVCSRSYQEESRDITMVAVQRSAVIRRLQTILDNPSVFETPVVFLMDTFKTEDEDGLQEIVEWCSKHTFPVRVVLVCVLRPHEKQREKTTEIPLTAEVTKSEAVTGQNSIVACLERLYRKSNQEGVKAMLKAADVWQQRVHLYVPLACILHQRPFKSLQHFVDAQLTGLEDDSDAGCILRLMALLHRMGQHLSLHSKDIKDTGLTSLAMRGSILNIDLKTDVVEVHHPSFMRCILTDDEYGNRKLVVKVLLNCLENEAVTKLLSVGQRKYIIASICWPTDANPPLLVLLHRQDFWVKSLSRIYEEASELFPATTAHRIHAFVQLTRFLTEEGKHAEAVKAAQKAEASLHKAKKRIQENQWRMVYHACALTYFEAFEWNPAHSDWEEKGVSLVKNLFLREEDADKQALMFATFSGYFGMKTFIPKLQSIHQQTKPDTEAKRRKCWDDASVE